MPRLRGLQRRFVKEVQAAPGFGAVATVEGHRLAVGLDVTDASATGTTAKPALQRNQGGRVTGRRYGPMTLERDPEAGTCAILTISSSVDDR